MSAEAWVEAGLVRLDGASVARAVVLLPFQGLLVAFDTPPTESHKADYVMGIGSSSLTLANLTVRRHSRDTLDLGTGCGIQAFLAARHSETVLAADRNPRAVDFAAFNALLNGLSNVECAEGDLFAPASERRFDLVVSNPPFVISPETRYVYRDSGLSGDEVCRKIVREVPQYLNEGGYCQMLCNWAHIADEDWRARLAGWFADTGCDAWVMCSETRDAATYAWTWIQHTERDDPEGLHAQFERWLRCYEKARIEAVSAGVITMRQRRGSRNWFRADEAPEKMLGPCGEDVLRAFEARDFLDSLTDDGGLLEAVLHASPDVRLDQEAEPTGEAWRPRTRKLRLARGLAYSGTVDPLVADVVARCDGRRTLGAALAETASSLGFDADGLEPACVAVARRLVEQGFLLPERLGV
jgi:ubiquinone/menaquinone biosynthesis C-methylase UbiE